MSLIQGARAGHVVMEAFKRDTPSCTSSALITEGAALLFKDNAEEMKIEQCNVKVTDMQHQAKQCGGRALLKHTHG
jgi:hypothetical protein